MGNMMLLAILLPIIGAFSLPFIGRISPKFRNLLAFLLVAGAFIASASLTGLILSNRTVNLFIPLVLGLDLNLTADALAVFMALSASFVSLFIVLYSFGYIKHEENQNEYYLMVVLFLGAMMGLVYSKNLIFIYLFWEISSICSWRLIGFYREREVGLRADKAFLVTVFGALAMLLGFIILHGDFGTFNLQQMEGKTASDLAVLLILFGIFSKSATLPFHTWLPDAGVAPSPVTALLHAAVLVKIGVFVFARIFVGTLEIGAVWHQVLPLVIAASAIITGGAALVENDIKRVIAYSTVSQLAFIFLGLFMNNPLAITGGLFFILAHALAKGGLFLCAGIVEHTVHTKDIRKMGGLAKSMPVTAAAFALCSLSVMGIPPFSGFFAKYMIISGTVQSGHPWLAGVFMVGSLLTILYLFRVFTIVFMGETKHETPREGTPIMLVAVSTLAIVALLSGLLIHYPSQFIQLAVRQMIGS
ncbi:NADH:ubiquinone oxidoreductase subunit 5 (subunit L)/multisubunit Na+/H+ antiporter MnhA subunit [Hydrogenispora ethanolica]|jgi:NADH:ubiquinone oxidoreductase subunit 5 (subunit L)/multisubunit Na+/H+ antiporter MnhA subunit|uniref:NADH:ubiquinone oxidoreductase subunit 5 (Subunit L)/multisubunit Na+/H+ antiporter MnhA subunit n=1 Tax=Hydrogenispora ethanolica TaxID=1082276 RepID=A0A4R1R5U6_HYDET|nr:NADH-quinone oxidoreductase subunit L [Hydrogenispora ethanolica]TCL60895.1 NADH:ubiquinone oxidoreductase subunit 5 (subunit L)/multisubunit Na+/H+ antiporter MnhA subunit [Hydrogenispora ethanolica]